jgi:hypothetical protein
MQEFIKKDANPESFKKIIDRILLEFSKLMVDQYGNYFCQNVLRSISPESRLKILKTLGPEIVSLSCNEVGTHSMQRLFEIVTL